MKYWLINYLSPYYLFVRICLLMGAGMAWFLLKYSTGIGDFFAGGIALLLVWNAVRPWKIGMSLNDIQNKLDELNDRYD